MAAGPALAANPSAPGTVPSQLQVASTITLTLSATAYNFVGTSGTLPGGTDQAVIVTNDQAGYALSVAASSLTGPAGTVAASTQSDHVMGGWSAADGTSNHAVDEATCGEVPVLDHVYPMTGSNVLIGSDVAATSGDCWQESVSLALPGATPPGTFAGQWSYLAAAN